MQLIRGLHNLSESLRGCVATIGNFDGLHLGHQAILTRLRELSAEYELPGVVMTFEPQPLEYFRPGEVPARLTTLREKALLLDRCGIDRLVCLHFDKRLASLSAQDFIQQLLVDRLGLKALVIGDDFRFGQGRDGDRTLLEQAGRQHGFSVIALDTHQVGHERVSSTLVREALAAADLDRAEVLLGRRYGNAGRVIHGEKRGRRLGVPTLNIDMKRLHAPLSGVFVSRVHQLTPAPRPAISYIGTRPVFNGRRLFLETHIFDYDDDCYGRLVEVEYLDRLRPDQMFASVDDLVRQMHADMKSAREYLGITE